MPLPPYFLSRRSLNRTALLRRSIELMALCDKLETARAEQEGTRDQFAAASVRASMHLILIQPSLPNMLASHSNRLQFSQRELIRLRTFARLSSTSPFAVN